MSVRECFISGQFSSLRHHTLTHNQVGDKKKIRFFQDVGNGQVPSPDGPRNLKRHMDFNPRQQSGVKSKYIRSIKARGIVESVRGEAWGIQPVDGGPFLLLSCASLTEAFYMAYAEDPTNPNILCTLKAGLDVRVLSVRTPPQICRYLVRLHNRFHGGASTNFLELMAAAPEVDHSLQVWKQAQGINWQTRDYEAKCSSTLNYKVTKS